MTNAMMFAAGFGTRMKHLTRDRPKPLINVAGRPLIAHTLDLVQATRPGRIVANLHYKPDMLEDYLRPLGVETCREEPDILDTGGGLRAALPLLGPDPVLTTNTDAIWRGPNPLQLALDHWDPVRMDALLICVPIASAVGRQGDGDFAIDPAGRLHRGGPVVYGGVQILRTQGLQDIDQPVFSLNLLWDRIAASGRLFGHVYDGTWCDVGHPAGITLAEDMLADV